ncbi:MAG: hypothetical protein M1358_18275 [Chloroflexi bacterium]|nr:hypothetical protein [Chloroflexota bacterium]
MSGTGQDVVMVRVFGSDLATGGCGCGSGCCGSEDEVSALADKPSIEKQVRDLGTTLARYYGERVRVEYVDVFSAAMSAYPEVTRLIAQRRLPLPLVSVNGEPKLAGGLPLDAITEELEALGVAPLNDSEAAR